LNGGREAEGIRAVRKGGSIRGGQKDESLWKIGTGTFSQQRKGAGNGEKKNIGRWGKKGMDAMVLRGGNKEGVACLGGTNGPSSGGKRGVSPNIKKKKRVKKKNKEQTRVGGWGGGG